MTGNAAPRGTAALTSSNPRQSRRTAERTRTRDDEAGIEMQPFPSRTAHAIRSMFSRRTDRGTRSEGPPCALSPERRQVPDEETGPALVQASNHATTRSVKIYENILFSRYECTICAEVIAPDSAMWDCGECHHVFHFACIESWASDSDYRWTCPICKTENRDAAEARCWCGLSPYDGNLLHGNSCGKPCGKVQKCDSPGVRCVDICKNSCHPGPCKPPVCSDSCTAVRAPPPVATPQGARVTGNGGAAGPATLFGNVQEDELLMSRVIAHRDRDRAIQSQRPAPRNAPPNTVSKFTWLDRRAAPFGGLVVVNGACAIWAYFNVRMGTRPLEFMKFTEDGELVGLTLGVLSSTLLGFFNGMFTPLAVASTMCMFWEACGWGILRIVTWRMRIKAPFCILLVLGTLGLMVWFPVVYFAVPNYTYYQQMRNACDGFDTRTRLSGVHTGHLSLYNPVLNPHDYNHLAGIDEFNLYTITQSHIHPSEPWHKYTRVTGTLSPNKTFAVDFDTRSHMYRTIPLSFPADSATLPVTSNGTWSATTDENPHATFPEMGLAITNLHYFKRHCSYQPFVTVFRTDGMRPVDIDAQARRRWTGHSEPNVVARTVAFSASLPKVQACAKRGDYTVTATRATAEVNEGIKKTGIAQWEEEKVIKGLGDEIMVPIGLLAVFRKEKGDDSGYGC